MTKNMGLIDRTLRIAAALVIAGLYFTHRISGTVAIVLMVFAVVFIVTSFISWCPAYLPFGISTRGKNEQ
ncbi:MAG: DUF2892 domain-containing protein [Gemmatimonadales bacterium]